MYVIKRGNKQGIGDNSGGERVELEIMNWICAETVFPHNHCYKATKNITTTSCFLSWVSRKV